MVPPHEGIVKELYAQRAVSDHQATIPCISPVQRTPNKHIRLLRRVLIGAGALASRFGPNLAQD